MTPSNASTATASGASDKTFAPAPSWKAESDPLLEISDLEVAFRSSTGLVPAVRKANLTLYPGQSVAIVGESGSGKSTLAHAVIGLLPGTGRITGGTIRFQGRDITHLGTQELTALRGSSIGLVPQDPMSNLNPVWSIGFQVKEALRANGLAGVADDRLAHLMAEHAGHTGHTGHTGHAGRTGHADRAQKAAPSASGRIDVDEQVEKARKNGFVETILGRKRHLKDINSNNFVVRGHAERNAVNAPIQGSAADIIKVAMINIDKALSEGGFKTKMLLQVHDELLFEVPEEEIEPIKTLIKEKMESAVKTKVPLIVEVGVGNNWLEAH